MCHAPLLHSRPTCWYTHSKLLLYGAVCKGCRRKTQSFRPTAAVSSQQVTTTAAGCTQNKSVNDFVHAMQAPASKQTTASILQEPAEVVQLYRHPGLSKSAAAALLRKVSLSSYGSSSLTDCSAHCMYSITLLLQFGVVISGAANSELRHRVS